MGNGAKALVLSNIFQPLEHSINFQVFGLISEILQTFRTCLPFPLRPEETGGMLPTPVLAGGLSFLCSILYSLPCPINLTLFASRNFLTQLWELACCQSVGAGWRSRQELMLHSGVWKPQGSRLETWAKLLWWSPEDNSFLRKTSILALKSSTDWTWPTLQLEVIAFHQNLLI